MRRFYLNIVPTHMGYFKGFACIRFQLRIFKSNHLALKDIKTRYRTEFFRLTEEKLQPKANPKKWSAALNRFLDGVNETKPVQVVHTGFEGTYPRQDNGFGGKYFL